MADTSMTTTEELFSFAQTNHIPGGMLMFAKDLGALEMGQVATFYNERQLRRLAAGEHVQATPLHGPLSRERVARIAKNKPYAVVRL